MSGAYILQSNRANFNKNKGDPTCMICGLDAEDIEHFVLNCNQLALSTSLMDNCLLAILFSVLSSGNRNMLFKNVRAFMCI
jgi:hypothetical protein